MDWKSFKDIVKRTKRLFFHNKIQEITSKNHRPWDLINWIKKHKLLATKALQFNGRPCIELNDLWQALYQTFNSAQDCHINSDVLNKMISKPTTTWMPFSHEEFKSANYYPEI